MERLLSLSLVKAHSLFSTTHLQELEYFHGALKLSVSKGSSKDDML